MFNIGKTRKLSQQILELSLKIDKLQFMIGNPPKYKLGEATEKGTIVAIELNAYPRLSEPFTGFEYVYSAITYGDNRVNYHYFGHNLNDPDRVQ